MGQKLERTIGVLNGAVGDYLARTGNGLATPMQVLHDGRPLPLDGPALASALPAATPRFVLLVHGLMATEAEFAFPGGGDYGAFLARDFGYVPLFLRYNSGRAIADNGAELAQLLESLASAWPVPLAEILLVGHSMGGLVTRAACHAASVAGHRWLRLVRRAVYVGTPHRGAPLERLGRVVARLLESVNDPVTRLVAQIAQLRSDGLKDLGDADLRHEDRARRVVSVALRDRAHPVPMLPGIAHYLVAGSVSPEPWLAALFGDAIVPVHSATDGRTPGAPPESLPAAHVAFFPGIPHLALAHHPDVYARIRAWHEETP